MCTPALTHVCVPKVFAGPEMEKNFNDSEMVGTSVYVCVVPKSQAACIRKQKYILCFYSKQTQNTHLGYDNQIHRIEKQAFASTLRRSKISYTLFKEHGNKCRGKSLS